MTLFAKEKLVAPEISYGGNFSYDSNGEYYSTTKIYGYIKKYNCPYSYEFLLGLLNSNLFWFFIQNTGYVLRGGYYTFKTNYVFPFPIPDYETIDKKIVTMIENAVGDILNSKSKLPQDNITSLTNSINEAVYRIYNMSSEDVKTIKLWANL